MTDYRVIIAGCRDFYNYVTLKERCEYYLQNKMKTHNVIIVSGHASGADSLGEKFAADHNLQCELHPADWERHGRAAGPKRRITEQELEVYDMRLKSKLTKLEEMQVKNAAKNLLFKLKSKRLYSFLFCGIRTHRRKRHSMIFMETY